LRDRESCAAGDDQTRQTAQCQNERAACFHRYLLDDDRQVN
jgi:hypothetical protein